ncbi:MAG: hypothetical protein IJ689_07380 [Alphaproteobacteria bacterium]|nr:hypothetical protein [Alphaproteobacteria bacterium]
MKNYILLLGIAGVALGSYCAYAGNSATMTVTATIAHDVSLTGTGNISLGTITINPGYMDSDTEWSYSDSGIPSIEAGKGIVSLSNQTVGTFTANIPNPSDCDSPNDICGGLIVSDLMSRNWLGGSDADINRCYYEIKHDSGNSFKLYAYACYIETPSAITEGNRSATITINYNPG